MNWASVKSCRSLLSLSGLPSELVAVEAGINTARRFAKSTQWLGTSGMKFQLWMWLVSGQGLFFSNQSDVFASVEVKDPTLNSIESIGVEWNKWRTLTLDSKIAKTYQLVAVSHEGRSIVVFGGTEMASYITYIITEKGQIQEEVYDSEVKVPEWALDHSALWMV